MGNCGASPPEGFRMDCLQDWEGFTVWGSVREVGLCSGLGAISGWRKFYDGGFS